MKKYISQKSIRNITNNLVKEFKPEKIILFGSYAWGKPKKDSDVDLLIIKNSRKPYWKLAYEVNKILLWREVAVDALVYSSDKLKKRIEMEDPFVTKIMKKGVVLYE